MGHGAFDRLLLLRRKRDRRAAPVELLAVDVQHFARETVSFRKAEDALGADGIDQHAQGGDAIGIAIDFAQGETDGGHQVSATANGLGDEDVGAGVFRQALRSFEQRIEAAAETAAGDFFKDPLPRADLITMGMILHDWNLEKKMHLIRAAYDALPPGGALVAIEALIDDARRENVFGLLMSLNMLIEFGDAFDYSGADFRRWCGEAGFKRFEVMHLAGASSAAIAYK